MASTLMATPLPSSGLTDSYTAPMPPVPIRRFSEYFRERMAPTRSPCGEGAAVTLVILAESAQGGAEAFTDGLHDVRVRGIDLGVGERAIGGAVDDPEAEAR